MTKRPYTGNKDGIGTHRPGVDGFVHAIQTASGGRLWNDGTFVVRPMRGYPAGDPKYLSVHATGRAADVSRGKTGKYPGCGRDYFCTVIDWLVANADAIGLEMLTDYGYDRNPDGTPAWGRTWKCDRDAWKSQKQGVIEYGGTGNWWHMELDPKHADSTAWIAEIMKTFPTEAAPQPAPPKPAPPAPGRHPYPGTPLQLGSKGPMVIEVQNVVGAKPDGDFGAKTDQHVRDWQAHHGLKADGIVGPITWGRMFPAAPVEPACPAPAPKKTKAAPPPEEPSPTENA
jgi:peptidoglycan hydrolase-like protein with peptidoglycan-binding domain